jgi:RimJ/RimL family protein N-acetyltransferase
VHRTHELRTGRLVMRRWRNADRAPFAAMNADPEVMRHFPAPRDRWESDALVDRFEAHFDAHGFGTWALEVAATGEFIGFTGLLPMPDGVPGTGDHEVGWRLARHAWHQGYATEAGRAALAEALGRLRMARVWSITAVTNTPSQAVMERIGLVRHGFFEHPAVPVGHPVRPHVAYRTPPRR